MKEYKIYSIKNKLNGKEYIGITEQSMRARLSNHKYVARNNYEDKRNDFYKDMNEIMNTIGFNNGFKVKVIEIILTDNRDDALDLEKKWIIKNKCKYNENEKSYFINKYQEDILDRFESYEPMISIAKDYECRTEAVKDVLLAAGVKEENIHSGPRRVVYEYTLDGKKLNKYISCYEVAEKYPQDPSNVNKTCRKNEDLGLLKYKAKGRYYNYGGDIKYIRKIIHKDNKSDIHYFHTKEQMVNFFIGEGYKNATWSYINAKRCKYVYDYIILDLTNGIL